MRKSILTAIYAFTLLAPFMFALAAFALSVDRDTGMNSDGTAKFADPDEQMPNFMTGGPPEDQASAHSTPSVLLPMTPNASAGISINRMGPAPQTDAFEQAYGRK